MGRQTLRDWVHRFNASGPDGLIDNWTEGPKLRLSEEQLAEFARIVETGPDRERDGVVRWRRIDLTRVVAERFGVDFHPRYVGKLLHKLGFSHMSARSCHPAQDERDDPLAQSRSAPFVHQDTQKLLELPFALRRKHSPFQQDSA
jgi:transposase